MKFKSKMFLDEGEATRIALYLRSNSPKSKQKLFKAMSPQARLAAIKMETEQKKHRKERIKEDAANRKGNFSNAGGNFRSFRDDPNPLIDNTICMCGGYKYADADCCQNCSNAQRGWI
jgi:hypothetical protein